jgi:protein-S-isoprenylcysteine O-methyltransferase Ste14
MNKSTNSFGRRGEWYVVIQVILFGVIFLSPFLLPGTVELSGPWRILAVLLGLALGFIGGLLGLAGVLSLGTNLTAVPHPKENAELVESGAYKIVRHPIYSGLILAAFGWGILNANLVTLLLALVLFLFFDVKSRREERWLCEKYAGYANYQSRVRKLMPLIY